MKVDSIYSILLFEQVAFIFLGMHTFDIIVNHHSLHFSFVAFNLNWGGNTPAAVQFCGDYGEQLQEHPAANGWALSEI